jgi:YcxB-like protein
MELRYQLTMADYREWQYHYQKRLAFTYVFFAGGIFFTTLGASRAASWQLILGIFLLFVPVMQYLFTLRHIQISPNFGQSITMVPGPDGVYSAGQLGESTARWAAFTRFRETRSQFVLHIGTGAFCIIPKRAFSAPELEEFRNLLMHHIPRK